MSRLKFDITVKTERLEVNKYFIIEKKIEVSTRQG